MWLGNNNSWLGSLAINSSIPNMDAKTIYAGIGHYWYCSMASGCRKYLHNASPDSMHAFP